MYVPGQHDDEVGGSYTVDLSSINDPLKRCKNWCLLCDKKPHDSYLDVISGESYHDNIDVIDHMINDEGTQLQGNALVYAVYDYYESLRKLDPTLREWTVDCIHEHIGLHSAQADQYQKMRMKTTCYLISEKLTERMIQTDLGAVCAQSMDQFIKICKLYHSIK